MEHRCVEEEIAFVRLLPHFDEEQRRAWETRKRDALKTPWWGRGATARRLVDSMSNAGMPPWIVRLYRFVANRLP